MVEAQTVEPEKKRSLEGVKGWLLFFCILLTIVSPAYFSNNMKKMWAAYDSLLGTVEIFRLRFMIYAFAGGGFVVFSIYAGISLWLKWKNAVKIAKIFLVTVLVYKLASAVLDFVVILRFISFQSDLGAESFFTMLGNIFGAVIFFLVWYLYLKYSERVKATYHLKDPEKE